jgi:hypothetical protein
MKAATAVAAAATLGVCVRLAPPYHPVSALVAAATLVVAGLIGAAPAAASTRPHTPALLGQTLRASGPVAPAPAPVRVAARQAADTSTPTSTWAVTYDAGFQARPQARAAFQAAVDIWSHLVASRVPISVEAVSTGLDPGVLGQAGPTAFVALARDGLGGSAKTEYPLALANALVGRDLSSGSDITAEFDTAATDVYYGTDGQAQGKYDFETVVLHELGHGLGFIGSMDDDTNGVGSWGGGQPIPTIYDRFTVRSGGPIQGKRLLSYSNVSLALGSALTSGDVYWDGPRGKADYNGRPPRLYAPRTWEPASSYSHLSTADFPPSDINSLMTAFVGQNQVKRDPGPVMLGMFADMGWGVPAQPGAGYTPINPVRIMDTRDGTGGLSGRLGTARTFDLTVVGGATGVPTTASAVVLNVTGVGPSSATDLRIYPTPRSGTAQPLVSNLNLAAGAVRANLVTVPVGDGGRVRILNSGGALHVLADIEGWYGVGSGSVYEPTTPVRLLDTRDGTGGVTKAPVEGGSSIDLTVTGGPRGVPATATAVILTVTAVNATASTDIRVYPTPTDSSSPAPVVSNLNLGAHQIVPNLVLAKIGANGAVRLVNSAGSVDLVADLAGWFDDDPSGALFHVLAPQRVLDTRTQAVKRVSAADTRDIPLSGMAGVPSTGAAAVAVNLTGVDASQTTDVAVYPTPNDGSFPLASNLNLLGHQTAADLAVVATGLGGQIRLRNSAGDVALVVDIVGWFGP